jgi:uncharacterized protein (TIGR03437 family)
MLSGTTVTIGGIAAPQYFASDTQINAQTPFELQQPYGNGEKTLVVTTGGGEFRIRAVYSATSASDTH